jgi:hypothetical protein
VVALPPLRPARLENNEPKPACCGDRTAGQRRARSSISAARQCAQVAQLVEQRTENPCVGGSIPPLGTLIFNDLDGQSGPRAFRFVPKPVQQNPVISWLFQRLPNCHRHKIGHKGRCQKPACGGIREGRMIIGDEGAAAPLACRHGPKISPDILRCDLPGWEPVWEFSHPLPPGQQRERHRKIPEPTVAGYRSI